MTNAQTLITDGLTVAGGFYALASALAATLPASWSFTRFCATVAADLRGIVSAPATVKKPDDGVTHITFTDDK